MFRCVLCLCIALILASCLYPKNAFIIKIKGRREYRQVQLTPPPSEEARKPIRLKFIDTNTFQTTESIAPGTYRLSAATGDGMFLGRPFTVEPGKLYYEIPELTPDTAPSPVGPEVSGKVFVLQGDMPREVVVVFAGGDVTVRRSPVQDGSFRVHAPQAGSYRIEVIAPGSPPRTCVRDYQKIEGPLNLGIISLR